jgi:hypothetical protein
MLRIIVRNPDPNDQLLMENDLRKDYLCARCVINQDVESKILLRIRLYDRDGRLIENYGNEDLNLEARLTDADFDPKNPDYDF